MKNNRDKILILTNHSFMLWQFRSDLIRKLSEANDIVIVTPFGDKTEELKNWGCKLINTDIDRRGKNLFAEAKLYLQYKSIIKNEHPSKVITYSIKPNIYAGNICKSLGIEYCVNIQGLGTAFQNKYLSVVVKKLYKFALKRAHVVFFENQDNSELFLKEKIVKETQICVLNGAGVDLNRYSYIDYPDQIKIHILYLGRIMKEKGIDELFSAVELLKKDNIDFVLDLVGFYEDEYQKRVCDLERAGVIAYHGFQEDPRPFYANADFVVLPSYHEGMSNVLLEASAIGRPIITSNIPGCKEAIDNSKNGLLCEPQNTESLYRCIKKLCLTDKETRKNMGYWGRKYMAQKFDKKDIVSKTIEKIYR